MQVEMTEGLSPFTTSFVFCYYGFLTDALFELFYDRINWTGSALQAFYAAVRKALVIVIVLRAIGLLAVFGFSGWWLFFRP